MSRSKRRKLWLVAGAFVVVAAAILLVPPLLLPTLESQIARGLGIAEENLILNVPPGPQRLPGSIFVASEHFVPLDLLNADDPRIVHGQAFSTDWELTDWTKAQGSVAVSVASELVKNEAAQEVNIRLVNAKLLEMTAADLKSRVQQSSAARTNGSDHLVVIVRAVEATPVVRVSRNRNASLSQWVRVADRARNVPATKVTMDGQVGDEDALTFTSEEPVVLAFEFAKADFVIQHLGPQGEPEVDLSPINAKEVKRLQEVKR